MGDPFSYLILPWFYLSLFSGVLLLSFVLLFGETFCRSFGRYVFRFHPSLGVKSLGTRLN